MDLYRRDGWCCGSGYEWTNYGNKVDKVDNVDFQLKSCYYKLTQLYSD